MIEKAKQIVERLDLKMHPEGGYFKEVYRSAEEINKNSLPKRFSGNRNFCTSIYFLLAGNDKSHFHKIKSDEIWHFYAGTTIVIHLIDMNGNYKCERVGNCLEINEIPQFVVPHNVWFAAEVENKNSFALVGCTVSPGFDFSDFELAKRNELLEMFPIHSKIINEFTKQETI